MGAQGVASQVLLAGKSTLALLAVVNSGIPQRSLATKVGHELADLLGVGGNLGFMKESHFLSFSLFFFFLPCMRWGVNPTKACSSKRSQRGEGSMKERGGGEDDVKKYFFGARNLLTMVL